MTIAAVVLAAGESSRLGSPKQLVKIGGQPLVRRAALNAREAACDPIVVVLGAHADIVSPALCGLDAQIVFNAHWATGMASSVRSGVSRVIESDAVLITVCDQPYVGAEQFRCLVALFREGGKPIAAARYKGSAGTPAVFSRAMFPDLLGLSADAGARKVIRENADRIGLIAMPEAEFDIDSPGDLTALADF